MIALDSSTCTLLNGVFKQYPAVERVSVFGSRAIQTHRPASDIDLVAFGHLDDATTARIISDLEELPLPYLIDFICYNTLTSPPLRQHINTMAQPLYRRNTP